MKAYLKGEPYENFEIEVNKRLYPNSSDSSDKNFLEVNVKANVHGFNALVSCNVRADEISTWVDQLDIFISGKAIQIMFENMEDNIAIECVSDLLGHIQWVCKIKGEQNSPILSFKMETSIVAAEEFRDGFKRILSQYPVLGA